MTIDATRLPTTETKTQIRETTNKEIREMSRDSKLSQDLPRFLDWFQELMDKSSSAR